MQPVHSDLAERGPLAAALAEGFADDPARAALLGDDGAIAWSTVVATATRTARSLARRSEPVGVLGLAGRELLVVMLAAAMVGRSTCTLHGDWSEPELAAAITDAGVVEVFTTRAALPGDAATRRPPVIARTTPEDDAEKLPALDDEDPLFYVGFTSGSTGRPKPFTRRQRSWSRSFADAALAHRISADTTVVLAGSLQHSHFLFGAVLGWSQGASLRLHDRFDPGRVVADLTAGAPTVLYLVPTMLSALEDHGAAPMPDVRSVVISGAKMEPHHWQVARRLFPDAVVGELYGASEMSFITVNERGPVVDDPGYVGHPFAGVELQIRRRQEDEPGSGLVYVRSELLFAGYLEGGSLVPGIPDDGFVTVGDIGTIRPDGALSLRGRASNLVITGGKNVHPEEVELALVAHGTVDACAVVGLPHPYWGEQLIGCVEPAGGVAIDVPALVEHLRPRIAAYKIPKRWIVVEQLPRLVGGKVDRLGVRRLAAEGEPLAAAPGA